MCSPSTFAAPVRHIHCKSTTKFQRGQSISSDQTELPNYSSSCHDLSARLIGGPRCRSRLSRSDRIHCSVAFASAVRCSSAAAPRPSAKPPSSFKTCRAARLAGHRLLRQQTVQIVSGLHIPTFS